MITYFVAPHRTKSGPSDHPWSALLNWVGEGVDFKCTEDGFLKMKDEWFKGANTRNPSSSTWTPVLEAEMKFD